MAALLLLILGVGYFIIAFAIVRRIHGVWAKALAISGFVLLVTADDIYGRVKFSRMCEAEGGYRVYRKVTGVDGFYDFAHTVAESSLKELGYQYAEGKNLQGREVRLSIGPGGTIRREIEVKPISRYAFEVLKRDMEGGRFHRTEMRIRDTASNEILSNSVGILYRGGWVARIVASLYAQSGQAGTCGEQIPFSRFITTTLEPTK